MAKDETVEPEMSFADKMKLNALKSLFPMIRENFKKVDPMFREKIEKVELNPGETKAAYLISMGKNDVAFITTVTFNNDDTIERIIDSVTVVDFAEKLLNLV